jgi:hypothetical protein
MQLGVPELRAKGTRSVKLRAGGSAMSESTMSVNALHTTIREKVAHFRQVVLESVTADDVAVVFRKLMESAIEGSAQSAKLVLAYLFGRPGPHGLFAGGEALPQEAWTTEAAAASPGVHESEASAKSPAAAPPLTEEMSAFLSQPFTSAELDEARTLSLVGRGDKKANGVNGGRRSGSLES